MRIVIVEDEERTANRLEKQLNEVVPNGEVVAQLYSSKMLRDWLQKKEPVDVILMDIDLGDGLSIDLLGEVDLNTPIIFTTAFNQFALDAFKANSVDYLLKPIKTEDLKKAFHKLKQLKSSFYSSPDFSELTKMVRGELAPYQQRFLIRLPNFIKAYDVRDVAYFYIDSRLTFMQLKAGKSFPIDFSMDQLVEKLHPGRFFRLNRQVTTSYEAIDQMIPYPKSRIKLVLNPPTSFEIIVSSEKSSAFKKWLQGTNEKY